MNPWVLIVLIVSILFLLILFTPIRYELVFDYHGAINLRTVIKQGIFFNASFERINNDSTTKLRMMGIILRLPAGNNGGKHKNKPKPPDKGNTAWKLLHSFFRNKIHRPLGKLIVNMLQEFKPDHLLIKGEYGFFEPHYTAWANILFSIIPLNSPDYILQLDPVWDNETLEIESNMRGSLTLARIARHLILFIFSLAFVKFMLDVIRERKRNKIKTRTIMQPLNHITGINN